MTTAFSYLCLMAIPAMLGVLIWLISLLAGKLFRLGGKYQVGPHYEAARLLWLMFLSGLLGLTLTPAGFWQAVLRGEYPAFPPAFQGGLNLRPFHASWALLKFYVRNGLWGAALVNFPGNVIIFMPIGFFTALFSPDPRAWKSTLWSFSLSLCIEILQLFISRGTDVDDLILNTLGGLLGFLLFRIIERKYPRWVKSCSRY